ncbi:MAG: hypothetical protein AAFU41_04510 [Pseudomonadota bacterium]
MGSYFTSLMQHYGPVEAPSAVMPDMPARAEEEPAAAPAPMPMPANPVADIPPDPPPEPTPAGDANLFQPAPATDPFEPTDFEETHFTPDTDPPAPSEEIVSEVTERVVQETVRPVADDAHTPDPLPPVETHVHETYQTDVHLTETHLHDASEPSDDTTDPVAPEPPKHLEQTAEVEPQDDGRQAMLGALEAQLEKAFASLANPQEPPALNIIDTADFEPEGADHIPQLPPEEVREVTREIVKEIHHHHHETKLVPEKAPAPRTAATASQIGPIRLSSQWGTG